MSWAASSAFLAAAALAWAAPASLLAIQHGPFDAVQTALSQGQADSALNLLSALSPSDANTAQAHNLRCRVLFTLEKWEPAVNECQKAVDMDAQNSDYHMWLGRALGEQADHASFVSAFGIAKHTREEFEKSTELDPRNAPALADLGEFYSSAPGIVGGGMDKANKVAAQLDKVDQARAHELLARIAEGNKDYVTAENEFRLSIKSSPHPANQWMNLASFFRRRQRWDEMLTAVQTGFNLARRDSRSAIPLYNGATVLIRANRNLDLAAKLLDAYLASPYKTEEAPAFVAHVARARVAAQLGDKDTAKRERDAALSLAADYKPAQDLKF